jgi:uncharacterized coiled-coil DUF342 family protein
MPHELSVFLGEVNQEIRALLSQLSQNSGEGNKAVLSPGELKTLAKRLAQVAKLIDGASPTKAKEEALQAAISEYVENLEKLKGVLSKIQESLGEQRNRLKKDFEHANSARAWVDAFRATNGT